MRIQNADRAAISREKIVDYLLNPDHLRGGAKARLLLAMGFTSSAWEQLDQSLRNDHLARDYDTVRQTQYGLRFEIRAPLGTPSGRSIVCRSIWQIDTGTDVPRLITMYPD